MGPSRCFPVFSAPDLFRYPSSRHRRLLRVLLDRAPYYSPAALERGVNTTHQLGGISPQYDQQGKLWIFDSWSDGGDYSHSYTVPTGYSALSVTAKFVTGTLVTFLTNPPGLPLTVDGRNN